MQSKYTHTLFILGFLSTIYGVNSSCILNKYSLGYTCCQNNDLYEKCGLLNNIYDHLYKNALVIVNSENINTNNSINTHLYNCLNYKTCCTYKWSFEPIYCEHNNAKNITKQIKDTLMVLNSQNNNIIPTLIHTDNFCDNVDIKKIGKFMSLLLMTSSILMFSKIIIH